MHSLQVPKLRLFHMILLEESVLLQPMELLPLQALGDSLCYHPHGLQIPRFQTCRRRYTSYQHMH